MYDEGRECVSTYFAKSVLPDTFDTFEAAVNRQHSSGCERGSTSKVRKEVNSSGWERGSTGYDRKVWESLTHFYEVDAWLPRNYVMVNKDVWKGTSKANQNVINGCAELAQYAGTWRAVEYTQFTLNGLKAGGMKVGPASDKLVGELRAIGEKMTAEWLKKAGAEGKAIVDAYKAMK